MASVPSRSDPISFIQLRSAEHFQIGSSAWLTSNWLWFDSTSLPSPPTSLLPLWLPAPPVSIGLSQDNLPLPGNISVTLFMSSMRFLRTLGEIPDPPPPSHCSWNNTICSVFLHMKAHKPRGLWKWKFLSRVQLFATPWTIQSMEFSRPEYWSG